jgi:hypothetical protein
MGDKSKLVGFYPDKGNREYIEGLPTGQRTKAINAALTMYRQTLGEYSKVIGPEVMLVALAAHEARLAALEQAPISSANTVNLDDLRSEVLQQGDYLQGEIDKVRKEVRALAG